MIGKPISTKRCVSYRNQPLVLLCKTNYWFLYATQRWAKMSILPIWAKVSKIILFSSLLCFFMKIRLVAQKQFDFKPVVLTCINFYELRMVFMEFKKYLLKD